MSDNSFFEELQTEFLNESAFLLETYEESMLGLENGDDPGSFLTQIFRVAHSIKGGAAAVGLGDLSKFAHVVEDLLDLLRTNPTLVNSNVISLLLQSGDELKKRIESLQKGTAGAWDTTKLVEELINVTEYLSGEPTKHAGHTDEPKKEEATDDFFLNLPEPDGKGGSAAAASGGAEDHTNHDLYNELLAQMDPKEAAKIKEENAKVAAKPAPAPAPVVAAAPAAAAPVATAAPAAPAAPAAKPELKVVSQTPPAAAQAKPEEKKPETKSGGGPGGKGSSKGPSSSIKVDTGRVDSVLDAVGELVVLKNQLVSVHAEGASQDQNMRLEGIVDQLDKTVRELYEKTLSIRMTPLKSLFVKIQRIVRDVSLTLKKPVDLQLVGEETEVERTVFELLNDPMVHLVRNALDHGIEPPDVREQRGKSPTAKVVVSAKQSGGNVIIEIVDDGGGINRERVLKKAIERNLVNPGVDPNTIPDEQVFQFIFSAGFSTAEKVSDLSGRGVGLDVVKSNLDKINGKINISSKAGLGTTFRLTIPLSTAITDGIIVAMDGARYILPIHSIREIVRVAESQYTNITGAGKVANIRGVLVPVVDVNYTIGSINWQNVERDKTIIERKQNTRMREERSDESMLVIIETMTGLLAVPVDDVIGQAQVVVKPLTTGYEVPEVAGAAILGDGRTVLILDPSQLIRESMKEAG
jgi:two-component system chemotaxis sensor kinase CheA